MSVLLVAGSRDVTRLGKGRVAEAIDAWVEVHGLPSVLVHGGAAGVDRRAGEWAKAHGVTVEVYRPQWNGPNGRVRFDAGFERNTDMVQRATHVLCIWNGESKGTLDTINKTKAAGKELTLLTF